MGFVSKPGCFWVIFLLAGAILNGQEAFIETMNPVSAAVLRADQKEIAFTDQQNIYLLDIDSFSIRDTIPVEQMPQFGIASLKYVESNPGALMAKYREISPYGNSFRVSFDALEYPQDSTVVYNLKTGKARDQKLPGNVYISFATDAKHYVFGYNDWFEYDDTQGNLMKGSRLGELIYYPEKITVPASGIIRKLQVAPTNDRVAIAYLDQSKKSNDGLNFMLEIRTLPDMVIQNQHPLKGAPNTMEFSPDGSYLSLVTNSSFVSRPRETIEVFRTDSLVPVRRLPEDIVIGHRIVANRAWVLNDAEVREQNLQNEDVGTHIWSNLTPFDNIQGFFRMNENELILFGGISEIGMNPNSKNGLYKYSLKDLAIFSGAESFQETDTVINPEEILIQNNQFLGGETRVTPDGKRLIAYTGDWLHWWDLSSRLKMHEVPLENPVIGLFPGRGSEVLIFESANQKSYSDFNIRLLNLDTGILIGEAFRGRNTEVPDPGGPEFQCAQLEDGNWICNDSDAQIWRLEMLEGSWKAEVLLNANDEAYDRSELVNFQYHPKTGEFAFNQLDYNLRPNYETYGNRYGSIQFWDPASGRLTPVEKSKGIPSFRLLKNGDLLYQDGKSLKVMNRTGTSEKVMSLGDEDLIEILSTREVSYFFLKDSTQWADSIRVAAYSGALRRITTQFKLPNASSYFLTPDGLGYLDQDLLFTYDPKTQKHISWDTSKSLYTTGADISMSDKGMLLYRNKDLINLATLDISAQIPSFYRAQLLKGDLEGKLLLTHTSDWGSEDSHVQLSIADPGALENPDWKSQEFKIRKGALNTGPTKTLRSMDGNFALSFNDLSLLEPVPELYLIDIAGRQVRKKTFDFPFDEAYFMGNEQYVALYEKRSLFNENGGLLGDNEKTHILALPSLEVLYTLPGKVDVHLEGDTFLGTAMQDLRKIQAGSEEETNYYAREYLSLSYFLEQEDLYIAGSRDGTLIIWDPETQSPLKKVRLGSSEVRAFHRSGDKLYVLLANSQIRVIDIPTLELAVGLDFSEDAGEKTSLVWLTPEGIFKAAKKDIRKYHFVRGSKAFPLFSYELFLNRPDLILSALGYASPETIEIYKEAYLKRLRRSGFEAPSDYLTLDRPELTLLNREDIPLVSSQSEVPLSLGITPNVHKAEIYINGVPVATFDPGPGQSEITAGIQLNPGRNAVTIVGTSKEGIESDPVALEITNSAPASPSQIYYLGVGVSRYADSTMNLRYADKDVRRISEVLMDRYSERLQIDTLLNESVSRPALQKLKERLMQTDINDIVILSFSGHGLVDEDSRFYFATHDMDFEEPREAGFSYEEMQALLDGIPARRKLLLLDACNSGEIDSEEDLESIALTNENVSQHLPEGSRGSGVIRTKKKKGLQNSFELMRSLFYDLDRGNGSFVISAAGGREFAFESEAWGNGVFTYSFLNALYELGEIRISALRESIYRRVTELTGGQQKPTARSENIEWDWVLE